MSTNVLAPAPESVPRMSVASFFPAQHRGWALTVGFDRMLLALVLATQAFTSLRLNNTAFQDEALYLYYGHWQRAAWADGVPIYTHPEAFFSGAPQLYPVFGSWLDDIGGLALARAFSLLCMLSATVAVYWTAHVLFRSRYGLAAPIGAALVFGLSTPVMFVGHLATFDAPAFAAIAWGAALAVWSSTHNKSLWWGVLIGGVLALAVALKYATAIEVPVVLLLTLIGLGRREGLRQPEAAHRRDATRQSTLLWRTLFRGVIAGSVFLLLLAGSALTWARADLQGLLNTTLDRHLDAWTSPLVLLRDVGLWIGISLLLIAVGGALLFRRRPFLTMLLLAGTAAPISFQLVSGVLTSLNKHVALGLIIGAPLAGVLFGLLRRIKLGTLVAAVVLWTMLVVSLAQSRDLFTAWPNTNGLVATIEPSLDSFPYLRTVGDVPEPVQYALRKKSEPWQWVGTYDGSFGYQGLTGVQAYRAALRDNYFQLVYFDGSSAISQQLLPELPGLGFRHTSTVRSNGTTWTIWQRFDSLPG